MQPGPVGLPVGAFPATDRHAIDEPYTQLWFDLVIRSNNRIRNIAAGCGVLALLFLGLAYAAPDDFDTTMAAGLIPAAVLIGGAWLYNSRWRRIAGAVYPKLPWRAAEAKVLRASPCLIEAKAENGDPVYLRVPRARLVFRQIVARSGRVWLCGPDERGRVMVRVDGISAGVVAKVRKSPPRSTTPVTPVEPATARPIDEPVLAWLVRRQNRAFVISVVLSILLAVTGAIVLAQTGGGNGFGLIPLIYGLAMLALLVSGRRRVRQAPDLVARVSGWTPVPVRLDAWAANGRVIGPARGAIWLPDGSAVLLSVPRASIDLVANVQASHTLWIAGEPARDSVVAVGVPGYPILGLARLT